MTDPILIEVTRGPLVESWHRGAVAIAAPSGALALRLGDVDRLVYPRSAVKALQALPLIETGTADRFGFGPAEIALACGSHAGTERHTHLAAAMLDRAELNPDALGCGAHAPLGASAANALIVAGETPTQLHNNCSGKHAGMLATAVHLREPTRGYCDVGHPVQQRVHRALADISGLPLGAEVRGIDGCSVPNWAMPLSAMARMFAKLVTGDGMTADRRAAVARILNACWEYPDMVAGKSRADTVVMRCPAAAGVHEDRRRGRLLRRLPRAGAGLCHQGAGRRQARGRRRGDGAGRASLSGGTRADAGGRHQDVARGRKSGAVRSSPAFEDALAGLKV